MGQRLNVEILDNGKCLANSYYHWSAYSNVSCKMLKDIIQDINKNKYDVSVLSAIRILENTGAGLSDFCPTEEDKEFAKNLYTGEYYNEWLHTPSEIKEAKKLYPNQTFKDCIDRNHGLIAISESGMGETRSWEEGRIQIDLATHKINYNVLYDYDETDYDEKERKELHFMEIDFDISNMSFEQVDILYDLIVKNTEEYYYNLVICYKDTKKRFIQ